MVPHARVRMWGGNHIFVQWWVLQSSTFTLQWCKCIISVLSWFPSTDSLAVVVSPDRFSATSETLESLHRSVHVSNRLNGIIFKSYCCYRSIGQTGTLRVSPQNKNKVQTPPDLPDLTSPPLHSVCSTWAPTANFQDKLKRLFCRYYSYFYL